MGGDFYPRGRVFYVLRKPEINYAQQTTPEFGIVPKEALDGAGNVTNLSITSGAYTVAKADTNSQIVHLVRNKFFQRVAPNAPEEVEISFLKNLGTGSALGDYDFVEVRSSDAEQIISGLFDFGWALPYLNARCSEVFKSHPFMWNSYASTRAKLSSTLPEI